MRKLGMAVLCAAIGLSAPSAHAVEVTSIRIYNAIPTWLQVAEVIATQAGTGNDVALASAGATAFGTSYYNSSYKADFAIDGNTASSAGFYHSGGDNGTDYLQVTLAQAYDLASLTIYGRTDYSNRDDYTYQLFDGTTLVGTGNIDARNAGSFGTAALAASPVPEPATWAMMICGFALIGGALRRRPARATLSYA
jgi:hypothetical protein